tara:strand:+ start:1059 stop:1325 length:267 start_codon:yes stop_codon:yes gene_type:complete
MTEQVEQEQVEQTEAEAPNLSLQDIATMVQIIDICTKRGAFEGQELEMVGGTRNRVAKFLDAAAPKEEDGAEAVEGAEPPAGDDLPES